MQKGQAPVLILVGILVIVAVAGGAFYLGRQTTPKPSPSPVVTSQTPKPTNTSLESTGSAETANWKTYKNSQYSYSFKYPQELVEQNGTIYTKLPGSNERSDTNMVFTANVFPRTTYRGPKITDPVGIKKETSDKTFEVITDKLTLNGRSANKLRIDVLSGSQTENVPAIAAAIDLGSNILYVYISNTSSIELQKYNTTFDQILSTFKFQ